MSESYDVLTLKVIFVPVDDLQTLRRRDERAEKVEDIIKDFRAAMMKKIDGGMAVKVAGPIEGGA